MDKLQKLQEIANRGLQDKLPPEKKAIFDEAMRRGLITDKVGFKPDVVSQRRNSIDNSAVKFAKDMATPFLHPIDTANAFAHLGAGLIEKATGGGEDEKYVDAVGDMLKDRYGSINALQNTASTDPVGMISDLSGVMSLGGVVPKIGKTTSTIGKAIDPVNIVLNTAKTVPGKLIPESAPSKLYESAVKFRPSIDKLKRDNMVATALKEGVMPTDSGLIKLNTKIRDLNTGINSLIDDATKSGQTISKDAIYRHLNDLRKDVGGVKVNASDDLNKVDQIIKNFDTHLKSLKKDRLTPRELQDFKVDAYKRINFDLEQGGANYTKNEVSKALARAAKEDIEKINPNIQGMNQQLGDLLELNKELPRVTNRIDNHNVISLDAAMKTTGGNAIGGDLGATAGAALAIGGIPKVKARTALILEQLKNSSAGNYLNNEILPLLLRQGAIQSGRLEQGFEKL